ncbi:MAG: pilus assembly protein [Hyphomicrobium sp.]|nr:pilus assembly protein [Hyphomicrobium sp.]
MAFAQRPLLIAALAKARAFAPSQGGAIAVEFGFIFPIILTILLGLIEASTAISANLAVQTAARTGAHFGLVKPPSRAIWRPSSARFAPHYRRNGWRRTPRRPPKSAPICSANVS